MRLAAAAVCCLFLVACSGTNETLGGCDAACETDQSCVEGRCVNAGSNPDAGDIEFPIGEDAGGSSHPVDAGLEACASETTRAQQLPLDIYIMLDQSGSMDYEIDDDGTTAWEAVTQALKSFLGQSLTNVSVGLQYFGLPASSGSCSIEWCYDDTDCGPGCGPCDYYECAGYDWDAEDSCEASDYATPDVEIASLPGAAQLLLQSIDAHEPSTGTPTSAALQGAVDHARSWAQSHSGHVVIDILATDGEPSGCVEDMDVIDGIAAQGASGTPRVLTFVIGVGDSLDNLNGIASAGGTGQAFLVDTSGDVTQQFLTALNSIRGAALGCTYQIPAPTSGPPDYDKVNVQYTPGSGGEKAIFPRVAKKADCLSNKDAWYYDDPANPHQIILCSSSCTKVSADAHGQIDILLGCQTELN